MSVVAKFFCGNIVQHEDRPTADKITFGAVCRGAQNASWASSTPGGSIELSVLNDAATAYFKVGEEYEVHFTHAPKPVAGDGHQPAPAYPGWADRSKPATQCGICGVCAQQAEDGTLDWSFHLEHYGAAT